MNGRIALRYGSQIALALTIWVLCALFLPEPPEWFGLVAIPAIMFSLGWPIIRWVEAAERLAKRRARENEERGHLVDDLPQLWKDWLSAHARLSGGVGSGGVGVTLPRWLLGHLPSPSSSQPVTGVCATCLYPMPGDHAKGCAAGAILNQHPGTVLALSSTEVGVDLIEEEIQLHQAQIEKARRQLRQRGEYYR